MSRWKTALAAAFAVGPAFVLLQACDNGPSAVVTRAPGERTAALVSVPASGDWSAGPHDARAEPVRQLDGKPLWSATRRYSAEENARRAFERNGEAFGARSVDDFARRAHAFVTDPPKGVLTLARANGDTLFYDPKANVFAVANREGAPRTMFKPDEGMAYWEEQKAREASRRDRAESRQQAQGARRGSSGEEG